MAKAKRGIKRQAEKKLEKPEKKSQGMKSGKEGQRKERKREGKNKSEMALLLENLVLLQKTLADTLVAFKGLNARLDSFLSLVEKAAKTQKVEGMKEVKGNKELIEKIEAIIEQNKAIAEGMSLLEKIIKEKIGRGEESSEEST
ncbi:MAG: hypothetical protein QW199_01730 [Candidatus Pacearchaeota archaeon]